MGTFTKSTVKRLNRVRLAIAQIPTHTKVNKQTRREKLFVTFLSFSTIPPETIT